MEKVDGRERCADGKHGAAERMRENAHKLREARNFSCKMPMERELNISCAGKRRTDCRADMFERIADRIDRPSTTRHGKLRTKYGRETPCCEVRGYSIGDMRWGYCPKCGAEVVE